MAMYLSGQAPKYLTGDYLDSKSSISIIILIPTKSWYKLNSCSIES